MEGRPGHGTGRKGPAGFDGGRCRRWGISRGRWRRAGRWPSPPPAGGVGSSHANAARRVRLRIERPRLWRGRGHRPAGQFTQHGTSPSPYIVNAPSKEGVYSSPGMLRGSERKDTPAGDASWGRVTVQQPSDPGPCEPPRTTRPPSLRRRRASSRFWLRSTGPSSCRQPSWPGTPATPAAPTSLGIL